MRFAMCNKADIINPSDSFCILCFHKWLMTARMFFGSFVFPASFGIHVLHTGKALVILLRSHRLAARKLAQGASAVLPPDSGACCFCYHCSCGIPMRKLPVQIFVTRLRFKDGPT